MRILAVDTALGACSVALIEDEQVLAHHFELMERGHAEALAPMVAGAMGKAGMEFSSLDRLAVTTGPGTFTGQRVGLAFMRGLKLALNIGLGGITTLEAIAAGARAQTGQAKICVIHDAGRNEVYLLLARAGEVILQPCVLSFEEAMLRLSGFGACVLAGTAAKAGAKALGDGFVISDIAQPDALWVARLCRIKGAPENVVRPLYLRPANVKPPSGMALP